jgi:hypothetical protein
MGTLITRHACQVGQGWADVDLRMCLGTSVAHSKLQHEMPYHLRFTNPSHSRPMSLNNEIEQASCHSVS